MLLGGIRYLLPVIEAAHKQGYYVITADYIPSNIAHKFSDEYVNVSITDKNAVLKVAQEKKIDGIMSFGVDPGVVTAAYVQEKMNLPAFGPYKSVEILQNKDKFRSFLKEHGFTVPWAMSFSSVKDALKASGTFKYPLIVKPTDSAGSKGCSRVDSYDKLEAALENAIKYSISGRVIVEEFIMQYGCSSDSDCFSFKGELKFVSFSSQYFDKKAANPYTPSAFCWPSTFTSKQEDDLHSELQRLISLLNMDTSVYNVETRIGENGKAYIMEVSPRGGGNRLSEMLHKATGIDLITASVCAAVGDSLGTIESKPYNGHWAEIILHAEKEGTFQNLWIDENIQKNVIEKDLWVSKDEKIQAFNGANNAIGTLVLKFTDENQMRQILIHPENFIKVIIE